MGKGDVKNPETDDRVKHKEKYEDKQSGDQNRNKDQGSSKNR